jgi:transcriptional regulator with AAA-type ATPase domain
MYMGLFTSRRERDDAALIAALAATNPFSAARIDLERRLLREHYVEGAGFWSLRADDEEAPSENAIRAGERAWSLACTLRARLSGGPDEEDLARYEDVARFALYQRHDDALQALVRGLEARIAEGSSELGLSAPGYQAFADDAAELLGPLWERAGRRDDRAQLYALFFQFRRTFHHVFATVVGGSAPTARLREAIWESTFTHDLRRYYRSLHDRMGDITTLVVGASGTGKELVARAIALSRHLPFDARRQRFTVEPRAIFLPLNVAALSPTLVESELFGHKRGSFTGAVADREGWLGACSPAGAVFLDEIGELDPTIQVKLLRALQTRSFQRLGETETRLFRGKIIAASGRDLDVAAAEGRFRRDLYYRLCADVIRTPTLAERLDDDRGELSDLVRFIARRVAGPREASSLADEALAFAASLGSGYRWPGNVRELEQCVRNVLVRRHYRPAANPSDDLAQALAEGRLTADQLLDRYAASVYRLTGSYAETARRLGLDRRTIARRVRAARDG